MLKKLVFTFILILSLLLLVSCKKEANDTITGKTEVLNIEEYVSSLPAKKLSPLKTQINLLMHPLKDAIELYGDDYEVSWEGSLVKLKFNKAKCSFEAYAAEFEHYDWYNNYIDFDDCDIMEYLSFAGIEKVVFDGEGMTLTDGITIGMSVRQISEKLNVTGINYRDTSTMITTEIDNTGKEVNVYYVSGQINNIDYAIIFAGDTLSRVEITNHSRYLIDKNADTDNGKKIIKQALSFVSKNGLATFEFGNLSYKGKIYSSYYDSWFNSWQFTKGDYEGCEINVEQKAPHRIYVASSSNSMPFLFWYDGKYVDPILSFLGKWRDYNTKEYIDIKSISKEGIIVFDMYTDIGVNTGEMVLLRNLNTAINEIPQTIDAYLVAERVEEALDGDIQLFNGEVQSGFYIYDSQKFYLIDSLLMTLNGTVQYLPRSITGRVGAGPLPIHIPCENSRYTQPFTWGYMENFGRDDPNKDNTILNRNPAGDSVINKYLNELYKTSGLKYADIEYSYLHDYVFTVNNTTYNVWKSKDIEDPHYLYVDSANELLIRECQLNSISKHSKELIYKSNTIVSSKSYAEQKYVTLDGKITVDLANRTIHKVDSFVENIALPELGLDMVGNNERFMFFANIGNRFTLNGYVLFAHTTWGATLHITDSNVPGFDIGVYYLNSETFFLDPSIGVVGVPDDSADDKYVEDKVDESGKETKHIIREFGGKIIGYIYVDGQGKKTVKDYYGKTVGYYYPDRDVTTDFAGKIVARGDVSSALLFTK